MVTVSGDGDTGHHPPMPFPWPTPAVGHGVLVIPCPSSGDITPVTVSPVWVTQAMHVPTCHLVPTNPVPWGN